MVLREHTNAWTQAADYIASTVLEEVEQRRVSSIEDVYGVLQTFVPEEMLTEGRVEDADDLEVLVNKLWAALEREGAVPREDGDEAGAWEHQI